MAFGSIRAASCRACLLPASGAPCGGCPRAAGHLAVARPKEPVEAVRASPVQGQAAAARAIAPKQPGKLPRRQHAGRGRKTRYGNSGGEGPRHHFLYREPLQILVTTGISLVLSRPASPHGTGYHSPLSGVVSPSHHANALFYTALRADGRGGIVKPACNCATCGPAERDRSPVPASSSRIRVRTAHNGY